MWGEVPGVRHAPGRRAGAVTTRGDAVGLDRGVTVQAAQALECLDAGEPSQTFGLENYDEQGFPAAFPVRTLPSAPGGGELCLQPQIVRMPHFDAVEKGEKVDVKAVTPGMEKKALEVIAANPNIRAILMECTELPPYSDAVRAATGLPVFDSITTSNAFITSMHICLSNFWFFIPHLKKLF